MDEGRDKVTNAALGRVNSLLVRQADAYDRNEAALDFMMSLAVRAEKAPTGKQYMEALIGAGIEPPNTAWSEAAVGRILKDCGGWTAKTMYADLMRERNRDIVCVKDDWPQELHDQWVVWQKAERAFTDQNGQWVSSLAIAPQEGGAVQFLDDRGQSATPTGVGPFPDYSAIVVWEIGVFVSEPRPGSALVQALTPVFEHLGTVEWPMSKLNVWRSRWTGEDRIARRDVKWADIFRPNRRTKR